MQLYGKLAEAPGVARGIKNTLGKHSSNSKKSVDFEEKANFLAHLVQLFGQRTYNNIYDYELRVLLYRFERNAICVS